jgi:hypothetical protein
MFELIVLGLVVAGLAAIARAPVPKSHQTEASTPPLPSLWATQTDWSRFHKPTYLRRGIAVDGGRLRPTPPDKHPSPPGEEAQVTVTGEAP